MIERIVTIPVTLAIAVPADLDLEGVEAFVADAINESLRELQRQYTESSPILDYTFSTDKIEVNFADPANYEEGDAF